MKNEEFIEIATQMQEVFHPVVPFDPAKDKIISLDLGPGNKNLSIDATDPTRSFTTYIDQLLKAKGARYAIGGYAEYRTVYSMSNVFDPAFPGEEPRRVHLGIDIWGKPNTAVMAPLNGLVHSFAFNNQFGDYGATIILSHSIADLHFHTLYGHLSLNSIRNIREGDRLSTGDIFAEFGIPAENGHWPPHLHFQVILDIGEYQGDYPGVCKSSEKDKWLANSPDPDLILQLYRRV